MLPHVQRHSCHQLVPSPEVQNVVHAPYNGIGHRPVLGQSFGLCDFLRRLGGHGNIRGWAHAIYPYIPPIFLGECWRNNKWWENEENDVELYVNRGIYMDWQAIGFVTSGYFAVAVDELTVIEHCARESWVPGCSALIGCWYLPLQPSQQTHRIHVCYISIYGNISHQYTPNVTICYHIPYMDPMGKSDDGNP